MSCIFDITSTLQHIHIDDEAGKNAFGSNGGAGAGREMMYIDEMSGISARPMKTEIGQKPVLEEGRLGESASSTGREFIRVYDEIPDGEEKLFWIMVHVAWCQTENCGVPDCKPMKMTRQHLDVCKNFEPNTCYSCKRFTQFCHQHAMHCQQANCPLPICSKIKQCYPMYICTS